MGKNKASTNPKTIKAKRPSSASTSRKIVQNKKKILCNRIKFNKKTSFYDGAKLRNHKSQSLKKYGKISYDTYMRFMHKGFSEIEAESDARYIKLVELYNSFYDEDKDFRLECERIEERYHAAEIELQSDACYDYLMEQGANIKIQNQNVKYYLEEQRQIELKNEHSLLFHKIETILNELPPSERITLD